MITMAEKKFALHATELYKGNAELAQVKADQNLFGKDTWAQAKARLGACGLPDDGVLDGDEAVSEAV